MQTIKKGGLIQGLGLLLKVQKSVLMSPLVQGQQQDLQKLHPSMRGFECKYHQMQGHN